MRIAAHIGTLGAASTLVALLALAAASSASPGSDAFGGGSASQITASAGEKPALLLPDLSFEGRESHQGAIELAWFAPAVSIGERVSRTRRAALEIGAWNLDSAARVATTFGEGDPVERAEAAVELSPHLPVARMALAEALWLSGDSPIDALRSAGEAIAAIPRHPAAAVWFAGNGLFVLAVGLIVGGVACLFVAASFAVSSATHDLGDAISARMPTYARFALLCSLVLLPLMLGEGLLGLSVVFLALATLYSRGMGRAILVVAALAVVAGAYPVAKLAGTVLTALSEDAVMRAALAASEGFAHPVDTTRLQSAAATDPLALRALAQIDQRNGNLGSADARYQNLLAIDPGNSVLANNAAGVRLELGHMEAALDLYADSIALEESPLALFNLSQAYGRAFQVEDLSRTLARAQQLDGGVVAKLAQLQGTEAEGFVVGLPVSLDHVWERVLASPGGEPLAAELRRRFAPGILGRSVRGAVLAFAAALLIGVLSSRRFEPSSLCPRCGERVCTRCDGHPTADEVCTACSRLFHPGEHTDRVLRIERINLLRRRERRLDSVTRLASLVVPGAAGLFAGKPLQALLGTLCFGLALTSIYCRNGVVPDPLLAGSCAPLVFLGIASLAGLGYAIAVAVSLPARRSA